MNISAKPYLYGIVMLVMLALLASCGRKGPLFIPEKKPEQTTTSKKNSEERK